MRPYLPVVPWPMPGEQEAELSGSQAQKIWSVGMQCRCPRCGQGKLFRGFLTLAPSCESCGLSYAFADPADGPAFFVMMTMAIPVTAFGIWFELAYEPPIWAHLVLTVPILLLACIPILKPIKGLLVASQYMNRAEEGRLARPVTTDRQLAPHPR